MILFIFFCPKNLPIAQFQLIYFLRGFARTTPTAFLRSNQQQILQCFGDGLIRLLSLPGHACGQIGALVEATGGSVLLSADACWLSRGYRELRNAHWLTRLIVDDAGQTRETLDKVRELGISHPALRIFPTHCPEVRDRWVGR